MSGNKDALSRYREMRDFAKTPEPSGDESNRKKVPSGKDAAGKSTRRQVAARKSTEPPPALRFVIQKHWARRLHYDFRLEIEGTMKSWAVPKGPSFDPKAKRMAVHVEDHPIAYNDFEGTIPAGQYGAGKVIIWDRGHWHPDGDPAEAYRAGKLKFELAGVKLRGRWTLVRMGGQRNESQDAWLLIKEKDDHARPESEYDVTEALPNSVGSANTASSQAGKKIGAGDDAGTKSKGSRSASKGNKAVGAEAQNKAGASEEKNAGASKEKNRTAAAAVPETMPPQLATRVSATPRSGDWSYELKYDGYRIMTRVSGGRPQLITRNGLDWTSRMPGLARAFKARKLPDGWYDGEIVVLDEHGKPDFQALQNAFESSTRRPAPGRRAKTKADDGASGGQAQGGAVTIGAGDTQLVYFLFDLPWLEDKDLRRLPLEERQARLAEILGDGDDPTLRLSVAFDVPAQDMLESACRLGLEGVIGKRRSSPYVSGRSADWIKLKCGERQEFVIGGYTDPKGSRSGLGSLLLGVYDEQGALQYAGNVGSGFSDASLTELHRQLKALETDKPAFANPPRAAGVHWTKPALAAEVAFSQWTNSGRIRHAVFQGLRTDKPPKLMKKEHAKTISNPDRLVDKRSGARKGDVALFYERLAELILPHLKDRPVSLLRAPDGLTGELFFQKHVAATNLEGIKQLDPSLDRGHDPLVVVRNAAGLAEAAQMNVIELHTWNAVSTRIDRPDRISFDLDPGKGVEWATMQEAALLLRNFLEELELPTFVKTSGGKGLHVIVPIVRRYDWDTVKGFSKAVVEHMAGVLPKRFSAKSGPKNRVGKIFIDYLRNGFGATTVCAWSLRARPGMGVSVPISWDEVESLESGDQWNITNIDSRLEVGNDPWSDYDKSATALGTAMKRLGFRA